MIGYKNTHNWTKPKATAALWRRSASTPSSICTWRLVSRYEKQELEYRYIVIGKNLHCRGRNGCAVCDFIRRRAVCSLASFSCVPQGMGRLARLVAPCFCAALLCSTWPAAGLNFLAMALLTSCAITSSCPPIISLVTFVTRHPMLGAARQIHTLRGELIETHCPLASAASLIDKKIPINILLAWVSLPTSWASVRLEYSAPRSRRPSLRDLACPHDDHDAPSRCGRFNCVQVAHKGHIPTPCVSPPLHRSETLEMTGWERPN